MQVGDLVKDKDHEQYGIVEQLVDLQTAGLWLVVFWQCGARSGCYEQGVVKVC